MPTAATNAPSLEELLGRSQHSILCSSVRDAAACTGDAVSLPPPADELTPDEGSADPAASVPSTRSYPCERCADVMRRRQTETLERELTKHEALQHENQLPHKDIAHLKHNGAELADDQDEGGGKVIQYKQEVARLNAVETSLRATLQDSQREVSKLRTTVAELTAWKAQRKAEDAPLAEEVTHLTEKLRKVEKNLHRYINQTQNMDLNVEFCDETHVIEVALADTVEDMRRKVASAVGLPEDSFDMSFGDEVMGEGYDVTQLSAGDTIVVVKSMKFEAIVALRALGETDLTIQRLKEVEDPEVACLLLQAEVATVIPENFLINSSCTRLDLSAVSTVTRIEDWFLFQSESLTQLDLSSFNNLTHIDGYFACICSSLTAVDLSSLNSLTYVGDGFLEDCTSLTQLDLSSLDRLEHVGDNFLQGCTSLASLDVSALNSLMYVGEHFLQGCNSLASLDLSSLNRLEHIGDNFVSACDSLTAVDLSSLNSLTQVGNGFLSGCITLSSLNLSSLNSVTHFGQKNFCQETNLQTIHLSGCSAVVSSAVEEANLMKFVLDARPKRKRDESPEEDCKRPRLSQ